MATSPDFLRLATSATPALTNTVLDNLRDAVLVADARQPHLPLVLVNATARRCLAGTTAAAQLIETPLACVLGARSAARIETTLASLVDAGALGTRVMTWRCAQGEQSALTDIKPLASTTGQRLVMLSFAPPVSQPDLAAADQLPFEMLVLDKDLRVTYANAAAICSAGSAPGGLLGCSALTMTPARLLPPDVFAGALAGQHFHDALTIEDSGRTRRFEVAVQPLKSPAGIGGLVLLSLEESEAPANGRAQEGSEARLLTASEPARDIITIASADGRVQYVSGTHDALSDDCAERESNHVFYDAHPEDREELLAQYQHLVAGDIERFSREFRMRRKDGSYRWLASHCASALANPLINGVVIHLRDISERKQAQMRLAQREQVFRLVADAADGIIFEFESIDEQGARYFENRAVPVREAGLTTGISISMRDITERRRLEQEILDVCARERQSIGRDLHDGLGQELTGIALMLRGVANRIQQRCPDVVQSVNEIVEHLNQSIDTARALARGMLPVRTETGGLTCALRALAERSRELYGLEVNFRSDVCPEFAPSETNASHFYRIAQEALTNAVRHGGATLVDIFLAATATAFSLRISDNGEGFARAAEPCTGMGLKIMKYRADMIGAKFEIEPNQPHGAVITVAG